MNIQELEIMCIRTDKNNELEHISTSQEVERQQKA